MKSKILLGAFFFLSFAPIASAAQSPDLVLTQVLTESEAKQLNIQIPESTGSGFKSLEINVAGMGKEPKLETILFCKGLNGVIQWDNICPDLLITSVLPVGQAGLSGGGMKGYQPLSDPKRTTNTAIVALAALSVISGVGAVNLKQPSKNANNQQGYLAQLSGGGALIAGTQLGRGDKGKIWKRPVNQKMDRIVSRTGAAVSGFSPLATRILSDGNYQRSLVGPFSILIYPFAIALGVFASLSMHQQALPPSLTYIMLMMAVGIVDALAGLLISITFTLAVLIGGNFSNLSSVLTVAGVSMLAFTPMLLAGAFRPYRREVWDFSSLWERVTDYLLASILTGWVVQQIVLGLPGLSGLQLPIAKHARLIAIFAAGLIVVRFAMEDFSTRLFPQRLIALEPEYRERSTSQMLLSTVFKVAIFGMIAGKFIGISAQLFIGIGLFSIPLIMGVFAAKYPKSIQVQKWMPTGIIEMLFMTIVGYFLAISVQNRYPNARTYVLVSFVLLSLPGFTLKVLALFGKEGAEDWKISRVGKIAYRSLGVCALGALIYIIMSGLLVSNNV